MIDPTDPRLELCISPTHALRYLYDDDRLSRRLDVFEARTKGWFFDHAETLNNGSNPHVGFAVLKLVFSYFEMITKYLEGEIQRRGAEIRFKKGIRSVFPELESQNSVALILDYLWTYARNGLFHSGMTEGKIFIRDSESLPAEAIEFEEDKVYIDRRLFLSRILSHFDSYISDLRLTGDLNLIENFNRTWEEVNRDKIYPFPS